MFALASLVQVSPEAEETVAAYWAAQEAKEAAWAQYVQLLDEHNRRQVAEQRKIRRPKALILAERAFDAAEHAASWASGDVETALRAANPGAESRSVMATKRALLTPR